MGGGEKASMSDLAISKLDLILKAIEVLLMRTNCIEDFVSKFNIDQGSTNQDIPTSALHFDSCENFVYLEPLFECLDCLQ